MRGLVYMASRDKVDVDTFHKGIRTGKTRKVEIWLSKHNSQYAVGPGQGSDFQRMKKGTPGDEVAVRHSLPQRLRYCWSAPKIATSGTCGKGERPTPEVRDSRTSRHSAHAQCQVWQI